MHMGSIPLTVREQTCSWIEEQHDCSNFESLCRSDVSHQVSAQSDLQFGRRCRLKNFKMAAILDVGSERF